MKELKELKELYPGEFKGCYSISDIDKKLDQMNKSRDLSYDKNKITQGKYYDITTGWFSIELGKNKELIKCYVSVYLDDYDEETGKYGKISASLPVGWDYYSKTTNLKMKRESRGMTQKELADKAGISMRSLQNYEQGHSNINSASAMTVYKLAKALECEVGDLLEF